METWSDINIELIIYDLLQETDCVVVPDFGAFVSNYQAAELVADGQLILPPNKKLSFNANIKQNDALLINRIHTVFGMDYAAAQEIVKAYVAHLAVQLQNNQYLELQHLGAFRLNREGKLLFNQDTESNLLSDAYALSSLSLKSIQSTGSLFKENSISKVNPKRKFSYGVAASLLLPLMIGAFWFLMNNKENSRLSLEIFNFSTENKTDSVLESTSSKAAADNKRDRTTVADLKSFFKADEIEVFERIGHIGDNADRDWIQAKESIDEESTNISKSNQSYKYALIGGCFKSENNAHNYLKQLQGKGYDAQLAGKTKGGLYRVALSTHDSHVQALKKMAKIRLDADKEVWLLKN